MSAVTGLDHLGLVVRDLEASAERLRALGFQLTRRADHTRPDPSGRPVPAGSSQRSIMFQLGYLEVMAITDPTAGHPLTEAAARYEGAHILALATTDAQRSWALLTERGVAAEPPQRWQRAVAEDGIQGIAEFVFFGLPREETPEGYVIVTEHRTPELLRPPASLHHPNTAAALAAVVLGAEQPEHVAARYQRYTGQAPTCAAAGCWAIRLGEQELLFCDRSALSLAGGSWPTGPAWLAGFTLVVRDLSAARAAVQASGWPWQERNGELIIDLRPTLTLFLTLRQWSD
ncbi:MAG: VOC family protein [Chloroflexi bacterium]|nr:VOC family protein [Chloroflexota bacterium]